MWPGLLSGGVFLATKEEIALDVKFFVSFVSLLNAKAQEAHHRTKIENGHKTDLESWEGQGEVTH